MGQAAARANLRDVLEPHDLPITKGLQESIHEFERLEEAGELTLALARVLKIIDPRVKNPAAQEWERAFRIFDLLL